MGVAGHFVCVDYLSIDALKKSTDFIAAVLPAEHSIYPMVYLLLKTRISTTIKITVPRPIYI